MKIKSFICLAMLAGGLTLLTLADKAAAQYLGEIIWTATITHHETGPVIPPETTTVTVGLTRTGGNYYSFRGHVAGSYPTILNGGGVLLGDTLCLTGSSAQQEEFDHRNSGGVVYIELNRTTLNGTFFEVRTSFNTVGASFGNHYTAGTLTRTGGISALGMSFPGATGLLLE